jgi:hypothetical protein
MNTRMDVLPSPTGHARSGPQKNALDPQQRRALAARKEVHAAFNAFFIRGAAAGWFDGGAQPTWAADMDCRPAAKTERIRRLARYVRRGSTEYGKRAKPGDDQR